MRRSSVNLAVDPISILSKGKLRSLLLSRYLLLIIIASNTFVDQLEQNLIEETAKITGGSLDYIIANAALQSDWSAHNPIGTL